MFLTLLCVLFISLLITWALIFPGGPLGFIMLYRVSYYVASSVRTTGKNTSKDSFGSLWVKVSNSSFFINKNKDVHHRLLDDLAGSLAGNLGYSLGLARIDATTTSFKFSKPLDLDQW
jgi:hypothetical protein